MIPKPFSRALMRVSRQIAVPLDADEKQMGEFHADLQAALDRVREFSEMHVCEVGSGEFPKYARKFAPSISRNEAE
jgi:hypothetical protein